MRGWWLPLIGILAAPGSCDPPPPPKVISFNVTPKLVCPGGTVKATWEVSGGVALLGDTTVDLSQVDSEDELLDALKVKTPSGEKDIVVNGPITFQAASWVSQESFAKSQGIFVDVVKNGAIEAVFPACPPAGLWGPWQVENDWSDKVVVTIIENMEVKPMTVGHGGKTVVITESSPDELAEPWPMAGSWTASIVPPEGQGCPDQSGLSSPGNPALKKPNPLRARLVYECP